MREAHNKKRSAAKKTKKKIRNSVNSCQKSANKFFFKKNKKKQNNQLLMSDNNVNEKKLDEVICKGVQWTFTAFDVSQPIPLHPKMECLVYQLEKAPKTGTLHFQGAFKLLNRNGVQFKTVQKYIPVGCHIEPSRGTWAENYAYCTKLESRAIPDQEPVLLGTPPKDPHQKIAKNDKLTQLVEDAMKYHSLKSIVKKDGATYARNYRAIQHIRDMFKPGKEVKYSFKDFRIAPQQFIPNVCLVFVGPTGVGKTQYAKSHFLTPLLVRHIDDLKCFDVDVHDGIIFDDMDFHHWPATSVIHLLDMEEDSSINVKHGTAIIPSGTLRIFTCNAFPFPIHEAIQRRIKVVTFGDEPLFEKKI